MLFTVEEVLINVDIYIICKALMVIVVIIVPTCSADVTGQVYWWRILDLTEFEPQQ